MGPHSTLSSHAARRLQQRGIPPLVLDLLCQYGECQYHEGREILSFTKKALRQAARYAGNEVMKLMKKYLSCYAVFDNGICVTVAYQCRHLKRDR